MENRKKFYKLFYTGGWDSTYMLIKMARISGATIQPIYMINPKRRSRSIEQERMVEIIAEVRGLKGTKAKVLDLITVPVADIPENSEITAAKQRISKVTNLGDQYDYLARYAAAHGPIAAGIEAPVSGTGIATITIEKFGAITEKDGFVCIDDKKSTADLKLVFGNLYFPIYHTTEESMVKDAKAWGCEDVMKKNWFCHFPIAGAPCGLCHPCENKMESRMEFLLPEKSQKRYFRAARLKLPHALKILYAKIRSPRG